jgi:hypothetical protein
MADVNPYLNTPPTKLKRDLAGEKGKKRKQMEEALSAWRTTVPGPFRKGSDVESRKIAGELLKIAKELTAQKYDWGNFDEDYDPKAARALSSFSKDLDRLERDILKARRELKNKEIGVHAAHVAHSLKSGQYSDGDWYNFFFK